EKLRSETRSSRQCDRECCNHYCSPIDYLVVTRAPEFSGLYHVRVHSALAALEEHCGRYVCKAGCSEPRLQVFGKLKSLCLWQDLQTRDQPFLRRYRRLGDCTTTFCGECQVCLSSIGFSRFSMDE